MTQAMLLLPGKHLPQAGLTAVSPHCCVLATKRKSKSVLSSLHRVEQKIEVLTLEVLLVPECLCVTGGWVPCGSDPSEKAKRTMEALYDSAAEATHCHIHSPVLTRMIPGGEVSSAFVEVPETLRTSLKPLQALSVELDQMHVRCAEWCQVQSALPLCTKLA